MSKHPITDAAVIPGEHDDLGTFEAVPADLARRLEETNAELVEALDNLCAIVSRKAAALVAGKDFGYLEHLDKQYWKAHAEARALLSRIDGGSKSIKSLRRLDGSSRAKTGRRCDFGPAPEYLESEDA